MHKNIFLFHGYSGKALNSWPYNLEQQLKKNGIPVFFPSYQESKTPVFKNWIRLYDSYRKEINGKSVFIGYSLGCLIALKYLEENGKEINQVILVAPVKNKLEGTTLANLWQRINAQEKEIFTQFIEQSFDWKRLQKLAKSFVFMFSDNDPTIPFAETKPYYENIFPNAEFITYKNYGHFNHKSGIYEMPEIFDRIVNC